MVTAVVVACAAPAAAHPDRIPAHPRPVQAAVAARPLVPAADAPSGYRETGFRGAVVTAPAPPPGRLTSKQRWDAEFQHAAMGGLIGAGVGLLLATPVFLLVPLWLAAGALGAGVGLLAIGGLPLITAGIDYYTGRP